MKDTYGTVPMRAINDVEKNYGEWKRWGIKEGDRVVVVGVKERERGKVGVVRELNEKAESCKVKGLNMVS